MIEVLFKYVADDFLTSLKDVDYNDYILEEFEQFEKKKDYAEMFDVFTNEIYHIYKPCYKEFNELFGRINIFLNIYSYNKEFYSYLLERLKADTHKDSKMYAKYLDILLNSDFQEPPYKKIFSLLCSNETKLKIQYKDKSDNITERIISDINFDFYSYHLNKATINAHCHLRNEERNFILESIVDVEVVK